jgi:hypothetical protein
MFIELQVLWAEENYEEKEGLGLKVALEPGVLTLNTNHICGYHPHKNGNCMIRLTNGDVFEALVKYKVFKQIMEQLKEEEDDFLISGTN